MVLSNIPRGNENCLSIINQKRQKMKRVKDVLTIGFVLMVTLSYGQDMLYLKSGARVVIGDTSTIKAVPGFRLFVEEGILTEKVKVALHTTTEWADDAFEKVPSISEVEAEIASTSHLLDMPSAGTLVREGYEITDMDSKLLQQIEWLWMQMITIKKENEALRSELEALKKEKK